MNRLIGFTFVAVALIGGCRSGSSAGPSSSAFVGTAQATIMQVPSGVACVQLLGGGQMASMDVAPGQTTVITLNNLPVGNLSFTAFAYANACAMAAGTQASWASAPTIATIVPGKITNLQLTLEPVGGATVGINFDTDGGVPGPANGVLWASSGGGGAVAASGNQLNLSIGGTSAVGTTTAPSGATLSSGKLGSDI